MMSEQQQQLDDTLCTLATMRQQEEKGYRTVACLLPRARNNKRALLQPIHGVDVDFRNKMVGWLYTTADFLNYNRETVSIAASHLDRFVMTPAGTCAVADRTRYQLATVTCLYIAAKLSERIALDPKFVVSSLLPTSNICYTTVEQIEAMEVTILTALQWRVNPPTSLDFLRQFFKLLPQHLLMNNGEDDLREEVYEMAKDQTELAVADYRFVSIQASTVALCSILNALHILCLDDHVLQYISFVLRQALGIDTTTNSSSSSDPTTVAQVQSYLYETVMNQPLVVMVDDMSFAEEAEEEDYEAAVVPLPLLLEEDVMRQDVDICERMLRCHQTSPRSSIIFPKGFAK